MVARLHRPTRCVRFARKVPRVRLRRSGTRSIRHHLRHLPCGFPPSIIRVTILGGGLVVVVQFQIDKVLGRFRPKVLFIGGGDPGGDFVFCGVVDMAQTASHNNGSRGEFANRCTSVYANGGSFYTVPNLSLTNAVEGRSERVGTRRGGTSCSHRPFAPRRLIPR